MATAETGGSELVAGGVVALVLKAVGLEVGPFAITEDLENGEAMVVVIVAVSLIAMLDSSANRLFLSFSASSSGVTESIFLLLCTGVCVSAAAETLFLSISQFLNYQ